MGNKGGSISECILRVVNDSSAFVVIASPQPENNYGRYYSAGLILFHIFHQKNIPKLTCIYIS